MRREREADVLKAVRQLLEMSGYLVLRLNSGLAYRGDHPIKLAAAGTADLLAIGVDQPALFVEVKGPTGKLSAEQVSFGEQVRRKGHNWCCVRSVAEMQIVLRELQ